MLPLRPSTESPRLAATSPSLEELDRLDWPASCAFTAYGVRVGVRANSEAALRESLEALPPEWSSYPGQEVDELYSVRQGGGSRAGSPGYHLLYTGSRRLLRTPDWTGLLQVFRGEMHLALADRSPEKVFIHAGVVGWHGQALLLPGRSFAGKSTLVLALVRAGATYYSDEYALLDEEGRVHAFPRPLSRRREGLPPESIPLAPEGPLPPLPVGLVAECAFQPGARFQPETLTPGEGVLRLLANAVSARRQPERVLAALRHVAHSAPVLRTRRGDAAEAAAALLQLTGARPLSVARAGHQ